MVFANIKKLAIYKIDVIKKVHFIWVSMYLAREYESTNWGHYVITSPIGDGTAILLRHLSDAKV